MLEAFRRDGWICRYCGGKTVFFPVMAVLGRLFPQEFPYDSHWGAGSTHPAVIACAAVVDHIEPVSHGGNWQDPNNLATACWPCNAMKGEFTLEQLGWRIRPVPENRTGWDGLSGTYLALWEAADRPVDDALRKWAALLRPARRPALSANPR
jgi:hypothetical protein